MSNSHLQMSGEARTRLRRHERPVYRYYDDGGKPGIGNCTWGIGTLAHRGPCSREELGRKVLPDAVEASFAARLADVEQTIHRRVPDQELTQEQFDALVSFTYNVGQRGAERVLYLVNNGDFKGAARSISKTIYMRVNTGRGSKMVIAHGLIGRRRLESAPFRDSK